MSLEASNGGSTAVKGGDAAVSVSASDGGGHDEPDEGTAPRRPRDAASETSTSFLKGTEGVAVADAERHLNPVPPAAGDGGGESSAQVPAAVATGAAAAAAAAPPFVGGHAVQQLSRAQSLPEASSSGHANGPIPPPSGHADGPIPPPSQRSGPAGTIDHCPRQPSSPLATGDGLPQPVPTAAADDVIAVRAVAGETTETLGAEEGTGSSVVVVTSDPSQPTASVVLQRKGRFTLIKPAVSPPTVIATTATAASEEEAVPSTRIPAASDVVAGDVTTTMAAATTSSAPMQNDVAAPVHAPPPSQLDVMVGSSQQKPASTVQADSQPTVPTNGAKKKGRFTLMQQEPASAPPSVTIVVDRAPPPPPPPPPRRAPSGSHEPDQERGTSLASTAMSSLSASVIGAPIDPPGPHTVTAVAPGAAAATAIPVVTTSSAAATGGNGVAASTSRAPTVKKMGRFVVSSVDEFDPQVAASVAAASQPQSATIPTPALQHSSSTVSEPIGGQASMPAVTPSGSPDAIPREVVTVVDPADAAASVATSAQAPTAAFPAGPQLHYPHGPAPQAPSFPPQPVLYALVPAPVQLPSQPYTSGSVGVQAPLHSMAGPTVAPPPTAVHAEIGSGPIRPSLSSNNLAAADVAPASAVPHVSALVNSQPAPMAPPTHVPAPLHARESSSVPAQSVAQEALHVPSNGSRSNEQPLSSAATATAPPPSGGTARTASGYTGRQGVGKMFHYLDQLRLEATDAERTIKNLMTDVRLLKEKNKELEATARDTERKLIEERKLRETAETKLKQAKKKLRELTQAASQPREDHHTKSASTSYDSLGIAASLSGEYRDDRMTIEPPIESVAAAVPPLSPPFARKAEHAHTPTRDCNPVLGDVAYPSHTSPSTLAAASAARGQPPVEQGRQSASNSPRTSQQARLLQSNSGKLPPLPTTGAPQVVTTNGGSARTPSDRPPLGSSHPARDVTYPSQNGTAPPNRSLAMEFDPMRPAHRDRLPSADSMSDLPEITSEPVAHAALPNPVHPASPTQRLASRTYHGVRDLHQQFHLQQPALDNASMAPTLHPSSSFSEFRHVMLVPQQVDPAAHGGSPIVFAFPSSFAPNGNHQWIPVAVHDPSVYAAQQNAAPVPEPDPFDEIVRRTSNPG